MLMLSQFDARRMRQDMDHARWLLNEALPPPALVDDALAQHLRETRLALEALAGVVERLVTMAEKTLAEQ